ncbi:MAG: cellulase family glycosylhydrolase [Chitinispirillales bacterium]|jgi:aryl-phospho-beta-D-glucosidase BglC (GH1 family)|nr:cellulase family glycosylhydrolase [Chitinispirillales bacterium]
MKYAKKIAVAALAAFALCGGASATPVSDHGQLSVQGNRIVNKDGNPVQLRGMSFFWAQWQEGSKFYNADVVRKLATDWKVSVVRAAYTSGTQSLCETVIDAAIAQGIYVIIDYHSHTANNETAAATTFFQAMATKYKDKPNIIYEIFNEPINQTWAQIKSYAETIVPAIRAIDNKNIILIGTRDYSKHVEDAVSSPVSGTNLAYVAHFYAAQEGHGDEIRTMIKQALNGGKAVFITEFGTCEADGNGRVDTAATNTWFNFLDANQISWANWSVSDKSEAASALNSGASTTGSWSESNYTASGKYIYNKLRFYANSAYTINLTVNGGQATSITRIPNYTTYTHGTPVTLVARPPSGQGTVWGGDISGSGDTAVVSMTSNKNITVAFSAAGNLLQNGTFLGSSIAPWTVYKNGLLDQVPNPVMAIENAEGKITMTIPGTAADHAYIHQTGVSLRNGRAYKLSFSARGQSARSVTAKVVASNADCMNPYEVQLSSTKQPFSTTFNMTKPDNTNVSVRFCFGGNATTWYISDVSLVDVGPATAVAPSHPALSAHRTAWSISNVGGALQLRGPIEAGATVSLYDTRGKAVRSMAAKDGLTLNAAGIPTGSYIVAVKNRAGADVYRSRVSFVR